MKRKIIKIDEETCNGCGLCISGCHEGALEIINGKAKIVSDAYCDGLGACIPECPTGALTIEERDAVAFDEEAVKKYMEKEKNSPTQLECGCPGTHAIAIERKAKIVSPIKVAEVESQLRQWPCQIKLVPVNAPYLNNAHLLVAADCTAYAYANVHQQFMKNKITVIGCPKLDETDYSEKLTKILESNEIKSVTVLRMEVPCCGGIVNYVKKALLNSEKMIPWSVVTISTDGNIIEE